MNVTDGINFRKNAAYDVADEYCALSPEHVVGVDETVETVETPVGRMKMLR